MLFLLLHIVNLCFVIVVVVIVLVIVVFVVDVFVVNIFLVACIVRYRCCCLYLLCLLSNSKKYSALRKKMEEIAEQEKELARIEAMENALDVTKQDNMGGFYR